METPILIIINTMLVWLFWHKIYKPSRIDSFRDELFQLRTELFEYTKNSSLAFDNPAYSFTRDLINAQIRFAHDFSFLKLYTTKFLRSKSNNSNPNSPKKILEEFDYSLNELDENDSKELKKCLKELTKKSYKFLLFTSPTAISLLLILLVFVIIFYIVSMVFKSLTNYIKQTMNRMYRSYLKGLVNEAVYVDPNKLITVQVRA